MKGGFWKAADGDPFDFVLIFLIEGDTLPFVVFLDMKSPLDSSKVFKSTTQARAVEDGLRNVTMGINCAKLFDIERILYIYITDHSGETEFVTIDGADLGKYFMKTIVMKSAQTKELLRTVWEVYKSGRHVLG